jgi:heme oxygenase
MPSWMLARLQRETQPLLDCACGDRMCVVGQPTNAASYLAYLERIYGFEWPVESAFLRAPALGDVIDLRWRTQIRLLRADLAALGVLDPSLVPACAPIAFTDRAEALGWMYVIERNALLHGQVRRDLERRIAREIIAAGSYLTGGERAVGARLAELGAALDRFAYTTDIANQIVAAARVALRRQHQWFTRAEPSSRLAPTG